MPYKTRKVRNKPCYSVKKQIKNKKTKRVYSKCASLKNAKAQIRLLNAIEYNSDFVPLSSAKRSSMKRSPK